MSGKNTKAGFLAAILILVLGGAVSWQALRAEPGQAPTITDAKRDKVLNYIRERFGVLDSVKLTMGALHASAVVPGYSEAVVTVDDGKNQHTQQVLVSSDSRFLILVMGNIMDLSQNSPEEMVKHIQAVFKTGPEIKLTVGSFKPSASPPLEQGTLTIDNGKGKQDRALLLTRDGRHLIMSELYPLGIDPRQQALRTISVKDEPTLGPATAPVTLVEYADLQCPTCARMHEFLETKVLPRYGNKVRLVYKEFPLVGIHDWSFTAAIACQCAYESNPTAYFPMRSAIFKNQTLINITNLRETLLSYGEQAGLDRVKLAGCIDAKASLPRVQRDMDEGKRINLAQTPTVFINGRMMVGLPSEDAYYQAIDAALQGK